VYVPKGMRPMANIQETKMLLLKMYTVRCNANALHDPRSKIICYDDE
jgi:hypothetical protein